MAANVAQGPDGEHVQEVRWNAEGRSQAGTRSKTRAGKHGPHTLEAGSALDEASHICIYQACMTGSQTMAKQPGEVGPMQKLQGDR